MTSGKNMRLKNVWSKMFSRALKGMHRNEQNRIEKESKIEKHKRVYNGIKS